MQLVQLIKKKRYEPPTVLREGQRVLIDIDGTTVSAVITNITLRREELSFCTMAGTFNANWRSTINVTMETCL